MRLKQLELPVLKTPQQLSEAMGISLSELRWLTYHRNVAEIDHYYHFEIPKRRGGTRLISAPKRKMKRSQKWIQENILEKVAVHEAAHGFICERSIVTNAQEHINPNYLSKTVLQVLATESTSNAESSRVINDLNIPWLDLNFGCPSKHVNRHFGGATRKLFKKS